MEGHLGAAVSESLLERARRNPTPSELDKLWTWVCGTRMGGGFVRGNTTSIAKALGITIRAFARLMSGQAPLHTSTIRRVVHRIDELTAEEEAAGDALSRLAWDPVDGTATDKTGRWYARYSTASAWRYLTATGHGYSTSMEARHAAAKMNALMRARTEESLTVAYNPWATAC